MRGTVFGRLAGRFAGSLGALGVLLVVLLGGAAQANAATEPDPAMQQERAAAVSSGSSGETQAIVVGGIAFVAMIGAAGAVLWFTARSRNQSH